MHIIRNIKPKGVYVSLGIYTVFYLVFWNIANSPLAYKLGVGAVIFYYLMLFICGFIAGRTAKLSGWLNGMIVGIGVPIINAIVNDTFSGYELVNIPPGVVFMRQLVYALICCGAGGFVADLMRRNT